MFGNEDESQITDEMIASQKELEEFVMFENEEVISDGKG